MIDLNNALERNFDSILEAMTPQEVFKSPTELMKELKPFTGHPALPPQLKDLESLKASLHEDAVLTKMYKFL